MTVTSVTNQYGYTEDYKNIHSNVTGSQAIEINNATTTTWSLKTQAAAFNNRVYIGPHTATAITTAQILTLDDTTGGLSNLNSSIAGTYVTILGASDYLWICHDDDVADIFTIKDNTSQFAIDGAYQSDVSHTNEFGVTKNYRVWRSTNVNIWNDYGGTGTAVVT